MDRNTKIEEKVINMPLCSHYRLTADKRKIPVCRQAGKISPNPNFVGTSFVLGALVANVENQSQFINKNTY